MSAQTTTSTPARAPSPEVPSFSTRGTFSFYASLMRRYRRLLAGVLALMLLYAGFSAVRLGAVGLLLDSVRAHMTAIGSEAPAPAGAGGRRNGDTVESFERAWRFAMPESWPPPTRDLDSSEGFERFLLALVSTLCAVSLAMGLTYFLKEATAIRVVASMLVDVRQALFNHLSRQSLTYFSERRAGDLISRVTNDVETVQGSMQQIFQTILQQPPFIASSLAVALWASPLLFSISLPIYALMVVPVFRSGRRVLRHGRGRQRRLGILTEALQQLFGGIRIVKAFGMEAHEREEFRKKNDAFGRSFKRTLRAKVAGRSFMEAFYNLGLAALMLIGAWLLTGGQISMGRFFTFIVAMVQVYNPVRTMTRAWNRVQESRAGVERVLEIMRQEPRIVDRPEAREFPGLRKRITLEKVSFCYGDDPEAPRGPDGATGRPFAVRDIDLEVRRGEAVALVGPSGSGKSTLADLLARFYEPQAGSIRVDGIDIAEYTLASFLRSVGIVSQDPFLFNTTIRENIRYGREDATDAEIEEAARAADAHEFILEQPEGYETTIGERGTKLSGGQRQRLTIARALLKNASILVLDEATSALDSEAEREVQRAVDNLMRSRTSFVIAHRLSTIAGADRIVVLEEGRIVEQGRHEELMARRGRYHELYTAQQIAPLRRDRPAPSAAASLSRGEESPR